MTNRALHRVIRSLLCFALAGSASACLQSGFLDTKQTQQKTTTTVVAEQPLTKANDRPTETGAGVPGYLVSCTETTAPDTAVHVGCRVSDTSGKRISNTADIWTHYDVQLPAGTNPNIKVDKIAATGSTAYDVLFVFSGADPAQLSAAAHASAFSYTYMGSKGETVKVDAAPAAALPNRTSCTGGILLEGVCMMSVASSCTDYCAQTGQKVHPWVVERFGSAAATNKQACSDLYAQFPQQFPGIFMITEIFTDRGLGCWTQGSGQIFFDTSPTDPSTAPYAGSTRMCGCQ